MDIRINLDKDFERSLKSLQDKYGEKMSLLNGFSNTQLDYTEFIDNFVDSDSISGATIDPNSNVSRKDVRGLLDEMSKPHQKLLSYNKIFYEIKKKYGVEAAQKWLELDFNGSLYLHDSSSATFYDYSYKGTETLLVKYRDVVYLLSFEQLFELVDEEVQYLDARRKSLAKYTNELSVWDNEKTWTKVSRVIKKPKTEEFHFIRTKSGHSQIVTNNHPVVTTAGDIDAADVTTEHALSTIKVPASFLNQNRVQTAWALESHPGHREICFRGRPFRGDMGEDTREDGQVAYYSGVNFIQNRIDLDHEFGWIVGMALSSGFIAQSTIRIVKQNEAMIEKLIDICERKMFGYSLNTRTENGATTVIIKSRVLSDIFIRMFGERFNDKRSSMTKDILKYGNDFIAGVVAGIIDGDGKLNPDGVSVDIRFHSRTMMNQVSFLLRYFGHVAIDSIPEKVADKKPTESSNSVPYRYYVRYYPMDNGMPMHSVLDESLMFSEYDEETFSASDQVTDNVFLDWDRDDFVYDITTDSRYFNCNGILSHNCYNYDLTRLATDGLYFLPATNSSPANHLTTFMAHLREFIVFVSNRSAGACALANFFVWVYYFWSKDVEEGYYIKDPEYYLRQCFQQFIYEVNQIHTRIVQSAYTNLVIMDRNYIEELFGGIEYPDGRFVIDHIEDIIDIQKTYMQVEADIRAVQPLTFPVQTFSLLYQDGKFVDEEFARWASDMNTRWYDSNFYIGDSVTSLASCCRMTNDIGKLREREVGERGKQFQSSIGGALVEIGSFKVSTINLAAIAYESAGNSSKFFEILGDRLELNMNLLDCIRSIYVRNEEKKLLPTYTYGLKDINKQTGTNGVTAMNEAVEIMGLVRYDELGNQYYTDEGLQFAIDVMDFINKAQDAFSANHEYDISCEVIPGESANAKLCEKDNIRFGKELKIYSNQWLGLNKKGTINERIRLSAELDKKAGGGQILHISLEGEFPNKDVAWGLLNYIASQGVIYFAFNPKLYVCKEKHTFMPPQKTCPTCGGGVNEEVTRIVGYLVPTKSFSKPRLEEYNDRRWYTFGDDQYLR